MCRVMCFVGQLITAIGAINWGLVAFIDFNLVEYVDMMTGQIGVAKVVYGIVAACGILSIGSLFFAGKCCSSCKPQ